MFHIPGCEDWLSGPIEEKPEFVRCQGPCGFKLEVGQDEYVEFEDEVLCPECLELTTAICIRCEHRDFKDTGTQTPKGFICSCCQRRMDPSEISREICHADFEDTQDHR